MRLPTVSSALHVSLYAAILVAWAAAYACVSAYCWMLYLRQPASRELGAFAGVAGSMALCTVGSIVWVTADALRHAASGQTLFTVSLFLAAAFYADFAYTTTQRPAGPVVRLAYAWAGVGVLAAASGGLFDPALPRGPDRWTVPGTPHFLQAAGTPFGYFASISMLALTIYVTFYLLRHTRGRSEVRLTAWAAAAALLAGAFDVTTWIATIHSHTAMPHGFLFFALAMSYTLIGRFIRAGEELEQRTEELRRSHHDLQRTEDELVRQQQLAAVGELSSLIAEELRVPLGRIDRAVAGLPTVAERFQRDDALKVIDSQTDRLDRLVQDLLSYARPLSLGFRRCHVDRLITEAIGAFRRRHGNASDVLEVELHLEGPQSMDGDESLLSQALSNVLEHLHLTVSGASRVSIESWSTRLEGAEAIVIQLTAMPSRAGSVQIEEPSGPGLGLALVNRVLHAHGGRMETRFQPRVAILLELPLERDPNRRSTYPPPPP